MGGINPVSAGAIDFTVFMNSAIVNSLPSPYSKLESSQIDFVVCNIAIEKIMYLIGINFVV
jgi:anti-anti-sigma regulatory factor